MNKQNQIVMKKITFILFVLLSVNVFAQGNFDFEFDYAQFSYDTTANYVEFYYSFNQSSLSIEHTDTLDLAEGILQIFIEDTLTKNVIVNKNWLIYHAVSDSSKNETLVGVVGFILDGGTYKCTIVGRDKLDENRKRAITEYITVNPFLRVNLSMSDIQLASNIIPESENKSSIFYKNTFEVMPIPTAVFGEKQPVVFFYTELYNVKDGGGANDLDFSQKVYNSRGQVVYQKSKKIKRTVNSRVEVGTVMAYKLPTDAYTLVLSLIDSAANFGVSSSKKFYIINPSVEYIDTFKTEEKSFVAGMFGVMSEEELDDFFRKSRYIATDKEIEKYESLTTEVGKRQFMTDFWKARDEDPSDDRNQFLTDYMDRIAECNLKYGALGKEGWQTDRGRVYLIYGEPSEIERHPNETETRPYEIWYYNEIEGGVVFIFADITGFSDYVLVHSTKRGEMRDESWQRRIVIR